MLFSDFACVCTIFGNITIASGSTSHNSPRDSVPAATYGAISPPLNQALAKIVSDVNNTWLAPNPSTSGSTCRRNAALSYASGEADHRSRERQMPTAAQTPMPTNAPVIMAVAPPCKAKTSAAAAANRAAPPVIIAQPSQRKSCRPCSTPENNGIHRFINTAASVTHNAAGFESCHRSQIGPWNTSTATAATAHTTAVHSQPCRIIPASCLRRSVASVLAV